MTGILPSFTSLKRSKGVKKRKYRPTRITKDGRLVLSDADAAKQLDRIYERDNQTCHLCGMYVRRCDASRDHERIRGMGGAHTDDSDGNIKLAHWWCNTERGSKPISSKEGRA